MGFRYGPFQPGAGPECGDLGYAVRGRMCCCIFCSGNGFYSKAGTRESGVSPRAGGWLVSLRMVMLVPPAYQLARFSTHTFEYWKSPMLVQARQLVLNILAVITMKPLMPPPIPIFGKSAQFI